jgi:RNA polymerase sigma-70 factor (sigma-E family)
MSVVGDHGRSRPETGHGPDEAAFRDYVHDRETALLRTAFMLTGNKADAEDLVQAALAKTYLAWGRINDRAALDNYVRRAMVNTHISWWRRRKLDEYPTDELPDQAVADHAGESDMAEVVRRALDRLPQRMRAAVMLRYFEDMTEPEIATALGISLGTVKSTVSRAVAKLRIDEELGDALLNSPFRGTIGENLPLRPGRCSHAQHDDGYPADRRVDHAVRDVSLRRPRGRYVHRFGWSGPAAFVRGGRPPGGQASQRPARSGRGRRPAGRHVHVEQRRAP